MSKVDLEFYGSSTNRIFCGDVEPSEKAGRTGPVDDLIDSFATVTVGRVNWGNWNFELR